MLSTRWIERKRLLPYRGEVLVEKGQRVEPWTPVAKIGYLPGKMTRVDVAAEMKLPPERIGEFMVKKPGDLVSEGEPIAKGVLFWDYYDCKAPTSGILGLISKYLGHAYIREPIDLGNTEPAQIDVAGILGVSPFLASEYLNVPVGRVVAKGQPIASRRKSWGEPVTHILSPTYGVLSKYDRQTGRVTITPLFKSTDALAYISGVVVDILPDEGVVIGSYCTLVNGVFGVGGEAFGEIYIAVEDPAGVLDVGKVTPECAGKVIVGGSSATEEALSALKEVGAKALVVGYLSVDAIVERFAPGLNMGITGKEDVPFTLILTEGFRPGQMAPDVFRVLQGNQGRMASCNGTTHIRAGVIRPEVIIPVEPAGEDVRPDVHEMGPDQEAVLRPGMRVRLLRRPYVGCRGEILSFSKDKITLESGILAHACEVRLDDGRKVTVPRSNCTPE